MMVHQLSIIFEMFGIGVNFTKTRSGMRRINDQGLFFVKQLRRFGLGNWQGVARHKPRWHFNLFCPWIAIFAE